MSEWKIAFVWMGLRVSTASPVIPEGLGYVIYEGMNGEGHQKSGSLHSQQGGKNVNQDAAVLCQVVHCLLAFFF